MHCKLHAKHERLGFNVRLSEMGPEIVATCCRRCCPEARLECVWLSPSTAPKLAETIIAVFAYAWRAGANYSIA